MFTTLDPTAVQPASATSNPVPIAIEEASLSITGTPDKKEFAQVFKELTSDPKENELVQNTKNSTDEQTEKELRQPEDVEQTVLINAEGSPVSEKEKTESLQPQLNPSDTDSSKATEVTQGVGSPADIRPTLYLSNQTEAFDVPDARSLIAISTANVVGLPKMQQFGPNQGLTGNLQGPQQVLSFGESPMAATNRHPPVNGASRQVETTATQDNHVKGVASAPLPLTAMTPKTQDDALKALPSEISIPKNNETSQTVKLASPTMGQNLFQASLTDLAKNTAPQFD